MIVAIFIYRSLNINLVKEWEDREGEILSLLSKGQQSFQASFTIKTHPVIIALILILGSLIIGRVVACVKVMEFFASIILIGSIILKVTRIEPGALLGKCGAGATILVICTLVLIVLSANVAPFAMVPATATATRSAAGAAMALATGTAAALAAGTAATLAARATSGTRVATRAATRAGVATRTATRARVATRAAARATAALSLVMLASTMAIILLGACLYIISLLPI